MKNITIIGAGLAGSFMAICLAQQGYAVDVYEARPDIRKYPNESGRSFNLTLYVRGINAIKKIGIWDEVKNATVAVSGNVAHFGTQEQFDPFDRTGKTVLYTVHRTALNSVLITEAEKLPSVRFFFDTRCITIDKLNKTITLQNTKTKKIVTKDTDLIIGGDGVNSVVRSAMQSGQPTNHAQDYLDWGYKEVIIPHTLVKKLQLKENATHTWPQPRSLLLAFPNNDTSFTLMFNLPVNGPNSFDTLQSKEAIKTYIQTFFPNLLPALPEITQSIISKPLGNFVTIKTNPWYFSDFMVLIGDAAHGVIPFYGQGMCAAFEDCLMLTELIKQNEKNLEKAFAEFQLRRKVNTDVLADLSKENFVYLRDKARSHHFLMKAKINTLLNKVLPTIWLPPLYMLIAHGTYEYAKANSTYRKQQLLATFLGIDIAAFLLTFPFALYTTVRKKNVTHVAEA